MFQIAFDVKPQYSVIFLKGRRSLGVRGGP